MQLAGTDDRQTRDAKMNLTSCRLIIMIVVDTYWTKGKTCSIWNLDSVLKRSVLPCHGWPLCKNLVKDGRIVIDISFLQDIMKILKREVLLLLRRFVPMISTRLAPM